MRLEELMERCHMICSSLIFLGQQHKSYLTETETIIVDRGLKWRTRAYLEPLMP